jgi:hypothetical protein
MKVRLLLSMLIVAAVASVGAEANRGAAGAKDRKLRLR